MPERSNSREAEARHRGLRNASADAIVVIREILEDTRARQNRKTAVAREPRETKSAYSIFRHIGISMCKLAPPISREAAPKRTLGDGARAALRRFGHLQRIRVDVDHQYSRVIFQT